MKNLRFGFTGAGGVGKTSVVNIIREQRPDIVIVPSFVRSFYAKMGVTNEIELHKKPMAERAEFQVKLFRSFGEEFRTYIEGHIDTPLLFERTHFDHLAYMLLETPNLSLRDYKERFAEAHESTKLLHQVFYFPYPASWTTDQTGEDGFRYNVAGKNIILDSMMKRFYQDLDATHQAIPWIPVVDSDPQGRAAAIMRHLDSM